ncbi:hypothetical protein AFI02nite_40850 [Aliivibrio fischeri]|uniref:Flp family type IVb pilin n=2 Tax=Aliivibrio fischeri TaxID=668 RepID=A0A510UN92_ALIFS|nr:hypothetical protein AFI02nite_40850 [Aliivibrio fischeri]
MYVSFNKSVYKLYEFNIRDNKVKTMLIKFFEFSKNAIRNFKNDERGVTAIEYAIIGVAISAIILLMFNGTLQQALIDAIGTISDNITSANDTGT